MVAFSLTAEEFCRSLISPCTLETARLEYILHLGNLDPNIDINSVWTMGSVMVRYVKHRLTSCVRVEVTFPFRKRARRIDEDLYRKIYSPAS